MELAVRRLAVFASFALLAFSPLALCLGDVSADELKSMLGDQNVFVKFYAPWCGHCKTLAPIWDELIEVYARETSVKIVKVDAEAYRSELQSFQIAGFPTLKFFPRGWKADDEPVSYDLPRTLSMFVEFVNAKTGSNRLPDGSVRGRVSKIDKLLGDVPCADMTVSVCARKMRDYLSENGVQFNEVTGVDINEQTYTNYYLRVLNRLESEDKSVEWINNEKTRLEGITRAPNSVDQAKLSYFTGRIEVLGHMSSVVSGALAKPSTTPPPSEMTSATVEDQEL